jgi:hypothetical protein
MDSVHFLIATTTLFCSMAMANNASTVTLGATEFRAITNNSGVVAGGISGTAQVIGAFVNVDVLLNAEVKQVRRPTTTTTTQASRCWRCCSSQTMADGTLSLQQG